MDTVIYNEPWKVELAELIQRARDGRRHLYCSYQGLWFSPDELEAEHRKGKFMWAAQNWHLRDPSEQLEAADRALNAEAMMTEAEKIDRLMETQHMLVKRLESIAELAKVYADQVGTGTLLNNVRYGFERLAEMASRPGNT